MHLHLPKPHFHLHKPTHDNWQKIDAVVDSVEWFDPEHEQFGYFDVIYSYRVGDIVHQGRFHDYGEDNEEYLKPQDVIEILFNPDSCTDCHYPQARTLASRKMMYIGMGVISGPTCC